MIGREFNIASTRTSIVYNLFVGERRTDLTAAFQRPPKCGERGGIKCQRAPNVFNVFCNFSR